MAIDKLFFLRQGFVVWFTGLPSSGKSTLALALSEWLKKKGYLCLVLDGDRIRSGVNSDLGYSLPDREENIRRVAEICKLLINSGIIVLCAFVSPTEKIRNRAREIIGSESFKEVFVSTSLTECEQRDTSGWYKRTRKGEIADFTGINSPFEEPVRPDLVIDAGQSNQIEQHLHALIQLVWPRILNRK